MVQNGLFSPEDDERAIGFAFAIYQPDYDLYVQCNVLLHKAIAIGTDTHYYDDFRIRVDPLRFPLRNASKRIIVLCVLKNLAAL
jgi:hypothetical protein